MKETQKIHFRWLKRYGSLNIGFEDKLIAQLSTEKTEILCNVTFDELFNVIHEVHITIELGFNKPID